MLACIFIYLLLLFNYVELTRGENTELYDNDVQGYYWRDYNGEIPIDALPGGTNSKGHTTYIGQVLHDSLLIPAKIDVDEKKVYFEWGYKEFIAYQNIKILCTKHPEHFEWFKTANREINGVKNKTFVVGGFEPGNTPLIGRKMIDNELVVGKVVFTNTQSTLNTTKDGVGTQHAEFEVLCYSRDKTKQRTSRRPVVINFYY